MESIKSRLGAGLMLLCLATTGARALTPKEILVVANSRSPEGVEIAQQYCAKRQVPESQLIILSLSNEETLSREAYDTALAAPLLATLESRPELKSQIKCLLTVYGVPIVVGGYTSTPEEKASIEQLAARLEKGQPSLGEQLAALVELAQEVSVPVPPALRDLKPETLSVEKLPGQVAAARTLLASLETRIRALPVYRHRDERVSRCEKIRLALAGPAKLAHGDDKPESLQKTADAPTEYAKAEIGSKGLERLYEARQKSGGALGLCEQVLADRAHFEQPESDASVDSELSLLYWGHYELQRWQPNLLNPAIASRLKPTRPPKTLMVARLDGPTPAVAAALVDRALQGESEGLNGIFFIDASAAQRAKGGLYKAYDESLERLARDLRTHTTIKVVLDVRADLFKPGVCPDAALYCGWYSPSRYIDSFSWVPGAVGYHITSFGAQGLHNQDSENWCKRMLEKGITATLGPVSEPYLHSFPPPEDFFRVFLSGKMSLVECYYLTNPFNSWRMILIGDPLYNPFLNHPIDATESQAVEKAIK